MLSSTTSTLMSLTALSCCGRRDTERRLPSTLRPKKSRAVELSVGLLLFCFYTFVLATSCIHPDGCQFLSDVSKMAGLQWLGVCSGRTVIRGAVVIIAIFLVHGV